VRKKSRAYLSNSRRKYDHFHRDRSRTVEESLLAFAERGARQVSKDFENPDDDWTPILFVNDGKQINIVAVPIGENKDEAAAMISMAVRALNGVEAVLLTSAWGVQYDKDGPAPELPPSMSEGRQEILMLTYVGTTVEGRFIPINRHPNKSPTLGEAEVHTDVRGRFVEAMQRAIAK
jgi:hypothetical protein